ncbi:hypothetical protein AA106555_1595 [Neokomagataea thailandica NBRC 106555]|uniref:STAS domain-containing protein n=2 Tax=Neokomagataea TaxID=1223423 RepID=A0A4Y6V9F7_9PROT|nr:MULTISPECIES: STAS domain-containing protein [Neokomagataea]QDH25097.1 hypothetical protein D5366_07600 [Neokomagataea tanensis]GBR54202.1 hypothetical protein AA106555_1595 [Neokomagataea thailandica NBRC 106555]
MSEIILPARLDTAASANLLKCLESNFGDVSMDASNVKFVGAKCLTILIFFKELSTKRGKSFSINKPSAQMVEDFNFLNITKYMFEVPSI